MSIFYLVVLVLIVPSNQILTKLKNKKFVNQAPVIGILTQPKQNTQDLHQIIQTYVMWIEMAGARIIPIYYDDTRENQLEKLSRLNGILFQGGDTVLYNLTSRELTTYAQSGCWLMEQAQRINNNGTVFPVWGICLGLELFLMCKTSDPYTLFDNFNDTHQNHPISFTDSKYAHLIFGDSDSAVYQDLSTKPIMHFVHSNGTTPKRFYSDKFLPEFYEVVSTNRDIDGKEFVSSVVAKHFPFVSTQFHPEKSVYDYYPTDKAPNSYEGVQASMHIATYFLNLTRLSSQTFEDQQFLYSQLIFRHTLVHEFQGKDLTQQVYLLKKP